MKIDVKPIEYLGNGEAVVELNTGQQVEIFYDPSEKGSDWLPVEEVTGVIGEWLARDTSDVPNEAIKFLKKAYDLCAEVLCEK